MNKYNDIINLLHHISKRHPQMSREARAAQFAPFAALTGYGDAINETSRITNRRIEPDEEMLNLINEKLNILNLHIKEKPEVTLTYFIEDKKKPGGIYTNITGNIRQIDLVNNIITLTNRKKINILDLIDIKII